MSSCIASRCIHRPPGRSSGGGGGVVRSASAAAAAVALRRRSRHHSSSSTLMPAAAASAAAAQGAPHSSSSSDGGGDGGGGGGGDGPLAPAAPVVERRVITVSKSSDLKSAARALILQLDAFGTAEVWATGSAGHHAAVGALVTAQELLGRRGLGLAATLEIVAPDGAFDQERRSIKKLVAGVVRAPPPRLDDWSSPGVRTSTKAVRGAGELAAALREGIEGPARGHALEARGEQGVARALRGLLALQAELGEPLAVWPWYGAVSGGGGGVEEGGEGGGVGDVPGTVLLVRRMDVGSAEDDDDDDDGGADAQGDEEL